VLDKLFSSFESIIILPKQSRSTFPMEMAKSDLSSVRSTRPVLVITYGCVFQVCSSMKDECGEVYGR
jgi:hypothetical protein